MSEFEDTMTRIRTQKSVQSFFMVKADGEVERSSYPNEKKEEAQMIGYAIYQLTMKARSTVRDIDPTVSNLIQNDLNFLRVKTKMYEIMVSPGLLHKSDKDYSIIVFQGRKNDKREEI